MIETAQFFAMTYLGPDAALTPMEVFLIQEPLGRMIEKYGGIADRFSGLIDPVMIAIGAIMYGSRINALVQAKVVQTVEPPVQQPSNPLTPDKPPEPPVADESIFELVGSAHR